MQNFNSDLKFRIYLRLLLKNRTGTVACFNSNPEFLSPCSHNYIIATSASSLNSGKSITDSNLKTAGESLRGVSVVSTCKRYMLQIIRQRHHLFLI